MKLTCPNDNDHKRFLRIVYAQNGYKENVEEVDEKGKELTGQPSLYLGDRTFEYECAECGVEVISDFDKFWNDLTELLASKTFIRNWTRDSGYLERGDFAAVWKRGDYIQCDPPDANNLQSVPKEDFKLVYENWDGYILGRIKRSDLRNLSRYTKYTISIIHQFKHLIGDR